MAKKKPSDNQMVYYFGKTRTDGDGTMKQIIGGKGANLWGMSRGEGSWERLRVRHRRPTEQRRASRSRTVGNGRLSVSPPAHSQTNGLGRTIPLW